MNPDDITPPQYRQPAVDETRDQATDVIRDKLSALYAEEPNAPEELQEVKNKTVSEPLSKHQQYMQHLQASGRDMAEIQVAWHEYYGNLSDPEKHEVWQEFYGEHAKGKSHKPAKSQDMPQETSHLPASVSGGIIVPATPEDRRTPTDLKSQIITRVQAQAALKDNHHVKSLAFGLSMGLTVVFFLMFSFFNERFVAPFIRPSQNVSATPIIVDPNASGPTGPEPKIIIPKINVEAPVVYDVPSILEKDVQNGLERGVVHYATTPNPGEKGNVVIFGHSSGNILNKGKYKFAFILLKSLEKDDTFIVQKDGKKYVYKVYNKFITDPTDVSVLGQSDRPAIMTLITCDPPGTSTHRLIIQAEQIFPDPAGNTESSVKPENAPKPSQLAGNSKSLWQRLFGN